MALEKIVLEGNPDTLKTGGKKINALIGRVESIIDSGYLPIKIEMKSEFLNRMRSDPFNISRDSIITSEGTNVSIAATRILDGEELIINKGWVKKVNLTSGTYYIRAKLDDDSEVMGQEEHIYNSVNIISNTTALKKEEFNKHLPKDIELQLGRIDLITGEKSLTGTGRLTNVNTITLNKGETIELNNPEIHNIAYYARESGGAYGTQWVTKPYVAPEDNVKLDLMIKKINNTGFASTDLRNHVTLKTQDTFLTVTDIKGNDQSNDIIRYISTNGSDTNSGLSKSSAYKTLQKAINDNATIVYIERGIYYNQSIVASNIKKLELKPWQDSYKDQKRQMVEFRGSDILSNFQAFEGIYRVSYSGNQTFDDVFKNMTLPIQTDTTRPTYNAVLWEGNDGINDYKMKPVLTIDEVKAEVGTFTYDGSYVYINPHNVENEFNATRIPDGLFINCDNLFMQDIKFSFYINNPIRLNNSLWAEVINCEASHSSTTNGFQLNNMNGRFEKCRAYKNRNDGFNIHYYGNTTFYDCEGCYNYDDGISHHEWSTGTVIGGKWNHNVKGGVIPVNNSICNMYNAQSIGNRYGFFTDVPAISQGNLFKDNQIGIKSGSSSTISINDTFVNNDVEIEGEVEKY